MYFGMYLWFSKVHKYIRLTYWPRLDDVSNCPKQRVELVVP